VAAHVALGDLLHAAHDLRLLDEAEHEQLARRVDAATHQPLGRRERAI
jgi:hypothetical protein